jgi:hypothetical protein
MRMRLNMNANPPTHLFTHNSDTLHPKLNATKSRQAYLLLLVTSSFLPLILFFHIFCLENVEPFLMSPPHTAPTTRIYKTSTMKDAIIRMATEQSPSFKDIAPKYST